MSFRLVGTALSVLGAGGASGYYMQNASAPNAVVVPVTRVAAASPVQLQAPLPVPAVMAAVAPAPVMVAAPTAPPYRITDGVYWQPRVWVGQQATHNPLTGWPLTREEKESGWVDAVPVAAAPAVVVAAAPVPPPMAMAPTYTVPAGGGIPPGSASAGAAVSDGSYRIHLESYRNTHSVDAAWARLRNARPAVLGDLVPSTVTVTVPSKGTFVRLLAGPFSTREAAERACVTLRKVHQYCHPVAPGHETT